MEKELLILGIIRTQQVHGYQLWELLRGIPTGVRLKRSNAYRILDSLERRGLITGSSAREGKRPERRVYEITEEGEREFHRMLRQSLAENPRADLPGAVALNYLDAIPEAQAIDLLKQRVHAVEERVRENADLSESALARHPGVGYAVAFDRFELAFLQGLIDRVTKES